MLQLGGDGTAPCAFRYETTAGGARACLEVRLNSTSDLNNNADAEEWLRWDSGTAGTNGVLIDTGTPSCQSLVP